MIENVLSSITHNPIQVIAKISQTSHLGTIANHTIHLFIPLVTKPEASFHTKATKVRIKANFKISTLANVVKSTLIQVYTKNIGTNRNEIGLISCSIWRSAWDWITVSILSFLSWGKSEDNFLISLTILGSLKYLKWTGSNNNQAANAQTIGANHINQAKYENIKQNTIIKVNFIQTQVLILDNNFPI